MDGGPQIDIYEVDAATDRVHTTDLADVRTVAGEPESILPLQENGVVAAAAGHGPRR